MPATKKLLKAELRPIEWDSQQQVQEINTDRVVKVQFNPETLTVAFANQKAGGDQRGGSSIQFVGQGTTRLTLDLWFDATAPHGDTSSEAVDDVRKLTQKVNFFIKPEKKQSGRDTKWIAPGVRFVWGTFLFDGVMDSLNEKLEYFSEDGKPLRAMLSLTLTSQNIQFEFGSQQAADGATGTANGSPASTPGTRPRQQARAGDTVQSVAARSNQSNDWRRIASGNNIENPRRLAPGTLIDPNVGR